MSPKTGCTSGSGVRCWLRLQRSVLSFSFSKSCLHQHHSAYPATCLFVVTLELLAWHSQGCVSHVYSVWEHEDSGCFSTRDPNSSNWGHSSPSLLNQCKGSAITPTLPSLRPHPGLEMGIATTPKAPGTATARGTKQCVHGLMDSELDVHKWCGMGSALPGQFLEIPKLHKVLLNLCPYR